jgi:putative tryptophan/tyrosine transport system substrate-binding protein
MRRREFIRLVGGAALARPLAASAQQPRMPVIGYLGGGSPADDSFRVGAFRRGLKTVGYVEGQNVAIEYRWAEGQYDRFPSLATDLVRHRVDVITALGTTAAALAAKEATTTIPVVFVTGSDPVKLGLVTSYNRPTGNLTGVAVLATEIVGKKADLLHETVPKASVVGFLVRPNNPTSETDIKSVQAAASALGQRLVIAGANIEGELKTAFDGLAGQQAGGLIVAGDVILTNWRVPIVALAAQYALPAVYPTHEFAAVGGLMSYGPDLAETYSQCGVYAGRILKGEKPADLPVIQTTKFELVINLKTAKVLGLEIPSRLLATADEVIE